MRKLVLLLFAVTLQLQSATGSPPPNQFAIGQISADSLLQEAKKFFENGLKSIRKNGSLCDYLRTEMYLATSERLNWSTYDAAPPDESLLNDKHTFWDFLTIQYGGNAGSSKNVESMAYDAEDPFIRASAVDGHAVSLTEALFPDQNFGIPHNKLLNMTYDCTTKQLSVHVEVNKEIKIIAQVLSLKTAILSIHVSMYSEFKPAYTVVLSGDTLLYSLPTFVVVRYNLTTKEFVFKGVPTDENSQLNVGNVLKQMSGTTLTIPTGFNTISDITFFGKEETGATNIAMKGISNNSTVLILVQFDLNNTATAFMADIRSINLTSFVDTALGIDISNMPLFGTLKIPKLGFSLATGEIRSSLLQHFVMRSSPLAAYSTTVPEGVTAYFTAKIGEIHTTGILSRKKLLLKVPPATPLSLKALLTQYSTMNILHSVPLVKTQVMKSVISSMGFDPRNRHLVVKSSLPVLVIIPGVMKLTTVDVVLNGSIGHDPSITELSLIGFWEIGSLNVHTLVHYNKSTNRFHVMATLEEAKSLNIDVLMKNVAGFNLPRALASFSLSSIVGNVYGNANYFLAMKGKNTGGTIYLLFLKDSNGSKVGITASISDMRLSDLVESAVGTDVTEIPYFGSLVIPSVMISITSDVIRSPALLHLLGNESALLLDGEFLPAGMTANFNLDIDRIGGILGIFADGVLTLTVPNSADFTMQTLSSIIPGISDAIQALPSEVTGILRSKIHSFAFNATNNGINIVASIHKSRFINSFLSLSNVRLLFEGSIGAKFSTKSLELSGNWYAYGVTSVVYDAINEEFSLFSDSNGEEFNINDVVERFLAKAFPLPSNFSSFVLTGITGRVVNGNTTVVMNGILQEGKISLIFERSSSETTGAIVVDISHFQLAEFILLATEIDISMIPFFGTLEIPQLRFAIATSNISKQTVTDFATSGSPLARFKSGIIEGISGQFLMQIGNESRIGGKLLHKVLTFKLPSTSTLSMNALLSTMPSSIRDALNNVPSELSNFIACAKVKMFSFNPNSNELAFEASLDGEVHIVPKFLSLNSVKLSLSMTLSPQKHIINSLEFCGVWTLENIPISMKVTYTGNEEGRLDMASEIEKATSQIDIEDLLRFLSMETISIPPMLSSVTLTRLSGNKHGNVTFIALSGSIGEGHVFIFYQKSPSQSEIGIAADTRNFRLSSVVSSAGVDISSIPFFGTLVIPRIGLTVASKRISNPLLSAIYPQASPLAYFGDAISKGVTATFIIDIGEARGVTASYVRGELDLHIPDTVELHLSRILQLLPNLENAVGSLPQILQDISSMTVSELLYVPTKEELQVNGNLDILTIIPDFLTLQQSEYTLRGTIGRKSMITFASFKGKWLINSLSLIAEAVYDNDMFLIDAYPEDNETLSLEEFVNSMAQEKFKIPSVFDAVNFTRVIGKLEDGTLSIVFIGNVGTRANISIVYEVSTNNKVLVFAADVQQFKLSDLIRTGTGIDISGIPLFGTLTIPALHLSISSNAFSTINLPDLNISGIPKELFLEAIPEGIKAQFQASIGTIRAHGEFYENVVTLSFDSSSLMDFLSTFSDLRSGIESLPSPLRSVVNAKINELAYVPTTSRLLVSLSIDTITIVPQILSIKEVSLSINTSIVGNQLQTQEHNLQSQPYHYNMVSFSEEYAKAQTISIDTLTMEGKWSIRGIQINTNIEYNAHSRKYIIHGVPNGPGNLNLDDLINVFSPTNLKLPDVLSSIKLENINAVSTDTETTIIVTVTAGRANVYLVFQKTVNGSAIAVAAEMHEFTLVDLVKTATGIDLSSVPFIGSFTVASMAFTVSNNPIKTPLLASTFDSDSVLQAYSDGIPNGLTAYFKVLIGECFENEVTYANKMLEFSVPSKCNLALRTLLSEITSINSVVKALPSPISDLLSSSLKFIQYDLTLRKLSIKSTLKVLTIIPGVMQLQNVKISVVVTFGSARSAALQSLEFRGDWIMQGTTVQVMVSYNQRSKELLFEALPKQGLTISHVINGFTRTNIQFPSFLEPVKLTNIIGQKSLNKFVFIFSGSIDNINVYVVYHYIEGGIPHIAVAAEVRSFVLADVIDGIKGIPYFGTLRIPNVGICLARGDITTSLLTKSLAHSTTLKMYDNTLPNGFSVKLNLPLDGSKTLVGSYTNKVLSFIPANGEVVSLKLLLKQISVIDINSIDGVFGNILAIGMKNVMFDVENKELHIELFLKKLPLFGKLLLIRDIQLLLKTKFSGSRETIAEAKGIIEFGKRDYAISIQRNPSTKKYFLSLNTDSLPIFGVISALGAAFLPEDLQVLLGRIFDINILNATIAYPFGANPKHVLISGTPQLFGLRTVHVSAVIIERSEDTKLIQKYSLGKIKLASLIKKLIGIRLPFKILDQNADISLLISPISLEGQSLSVPEFNDLEIHQGLSIATSLGWPSGCSDDVFCAVMKLLLGGGKLNLQGTITNARYFAITASVSDVSLGGGVVLKRTGLQFVGGVEPSTGLVGSIELKNPPVTLNAAIKLTVSGVQLQGSMSGCWPKAFGSPYITICNLYLAMTLLPVVPPVTGLEFGGRLEIGKETCGKVYAEVYVGVNVIDPNQNYFYADIGPLTFKKFFDALCINIPLPKPLLDSGFPKGLKTSFSLLGKELPHAGISIPVGFRFKGTIRILGLEATLDINISPTRFKVRAELPPMNIIGLFKMYKSSNDKSKGPLFAVDIGIRSVPNIEISGYVEVLGISLEARLLISNTTFEVFIEGKFLNLLQASLRISAAYSKSISNAKFEVEGYFKADLFDRIAKGVRDALKKSADEADKCISAAQDKIKQAQAKFDSANNKLERAKRKVDDAKRIFDVAIGKMQGARRKLDGVCKIRSCSSKCVGCPSGWRCCGRAWGKCICKVPGWNSCCIRVKDPICIAANAGCWLLKKPLDLILKAAIVVVDKSKHVLDVAKVALSVAQGVLRTARLALDGVIAALEVVKAAYKIGVSAISALTNFLLTQIINIREIHFKVGLSLASGGKFQCGIKGVLMGKNFNWRVTVDTRNIWSLIKFFASRAVPGLHKFVG